MRKPKTFWLIIDPCDGPHLFTSEKQAQKLYDKWKREAEKEGYIYDSFWEMSKPLKYVLAK